MMALVHIIKPDVIRATAVTLLVLLWSYTALSKLLDFGYFIHQLHNQHIPAVTVLPLAVLLPFTELSAAGLMLSFRFRQCGLYLSLALMSIFTTYTALVLLQVWSKIPCSCGGVLSRMSWPFHFWFNIFFLSCSVTALLLPEKHKREAKQ